uniref:Uncharacterized protein n=1 Tax=Solanum lycopersicum TaxID=4081 RepID=A0A3Q7ERW1_SOLLC
MVSVILQKFCSTTLTCYSDENDSKVMPPARLLARRIYELLAEKTLYVLGIDHAIETFCWLAT